MTEVTFWSVLLEILKLTIPAAIVGITVYFVMKSYLDKQSQMKMLELQRQQKKGTLPVRLQAYERLSLFCERISIPNLILRLRRESMTASDLRLSMMIAIRQEYEHNISQQVYVSENLWKILVLARDEISDIISGVAAGMDPDAPALEFSRELFKFLDEREELAIDKALIAIKKEASLLF